MSIIPLNTMTVRELREKLEDFHGDLEVRVWLPGSRIALSSVFMEDGVICFEGNVEPGSALCGDLYD